METIEPSNNNESISTITYNNSGQLINGASVFDVIKMKAGTHGCSGNHAKRLGGTEEQFTVWNFRNFNTSRTINIDTVRVYAANGVVISTHLP